MKKLHLYNCYYKKEFMENLEVVKQNLIVQNNNYFVLGMERFTVGYR
jgi:hypothetical protein